MDYLYTTTTAAAVNTEAIDLTPTPIEVNVKTETASIQIKGACGLQVSDALKTALTKTSSKGLIVLNLGTLAMIFAFSIGVLAIAGFWIYDLGRKNPEVKTAIAVGRLS